MLKLSRASFRPVASGSLMDLRSASSSAFEVPIGMPVMRKARCFGDILSDSGNWRSTSMEVMGPVQPGIATFTAGRGFQVSQGSQGSVVQMTTARTATSLIYTASLPLVHILDERERCGVGNTEHLVHDEAGQSAQDDFAIHVPYYSPGIDSDKVMDPHGSIGLLLY